MPASHSKKDSVKKEAIEREAQNYHFLSRKYGMELLLDIGRIESLANFIRDDTPHQLSFYDIAFIERGKGSFYLDETAISIEPCTVIFTSPGQVRRWHATEPIEGYVLFFEKDFLNLFFKDELLLYRFQYFHQYARPTGMKIDATAFTEVLKLVQSVEKEYGHLQSDTGHMVRAILYQLLVVLNRYYMHSYHLQSDTYIHPVFLRFRSLIENEFMSHHRITDYSQKLKMSTVQLNKICRQYSGLTCQQMIHNKLVSEIKKQLRADRPVKEIAYEFNFSDPSNFNRFFKKLTGSTAQQYRDSW